MNFGDAPQPVNGPINVPLKHKDKTKNVAIWINDTNAEEISDVCKAAFGVPSAAEIVGLADEETNTVHPYSRLLKSPQIFTGGTNTILLKRKGVIYSDGGYVDADGIQKIDIVKKHKVEKEGERKNETLSQKLKRKLTSKDFVRAFMAEFVATMLFVIIGCGGALASQATTDPIRLDSGRLLAISLLFGIAITVLVYSTAHLSGGHINPAVTIAAMVFGKIGKISAISYVVMQVLGGIFGALILKGLLPVPLQGHLAANSLASGSYVTTTTVMLANGTEATELTRVLWKVEPAQGFFIEFVFTALLVFVVFGTAIDPKADNPKGRSGNFAPLAIGLSIFLAHIFAIPFTNCGINPARSFGPSVVSGYWKNHWVFWIGPILGGIFGALVYTLLFMYEGKDEKDEKERKKVSEAFKEKLLSRIGEDEEMELMSS